MSKGKYRKRGELARDRKRTESVAAARVKLSQEQARAAQAENDALAAKAVIEEIAAARETAENICSPEVASLTDQIREDLELIRTLAEDKKNRGMRKIAAQTMFGDMASSAQLTGLYAEVERRLCERYPEYAGDWEAPVVLRTINPKAGAKLNAEALLAIEKAREKKGRGNIVRGVRIGFGS